MCPRHDGGNIGEQKRQIEELKLVGLGAEFGQTTALPTAHRREAAPGVLCCRRKAGRWRTPALRRAQRGAIPPAP